MGFGAVHTRSGQCAPIMGRLIPSRYGALAVNVQDTPA